MFLWGFSTLHSRLLSDQTQLKDDVDMLRRENGKLRRERNLLQQSWEDMKRLREEDQKEIGDLRAQQQQVRLCSRGQAKVCHLPAHLSARLSIPSLIHLSSHPYSLHPTAHLCSEHLQASLGSLFPLRNLSIGKQTVLLF